MSRCRRQTPPAIRRCGADWRSSRRSRFGSRRERAALRARRRAPGDGGAHRRPCARRRHRAAGRAGRLERDSAVAAVSTRRPGEHARDSPSPCTAPAQLADGAARGRAWRSTAGGSIMSASRFATTIIPFELLQRRRAPEGGGRSIWRFAAVTSATCRARVTKWPAALEEMGYEVTPLTGADLTPGTAELDSTPSSSASGPSTPGTDLAEHLAGAVRVCRGGRNGHRAVQHARTACPQNWLAPFQLRHLARPRDRRARAGDDSGAERIPCSRRPIASPRRTSTGGCRSVACTSRINGTNASRRSSRPAIPARAPLTRRPARGAARQGALRLHQPVVVSAAS